MLQRAKDAVRPILPARVMQSYHGVRRVLDADELTSYGYWLAGRDGNHTRCLILAHGRSGSSLLESLLSSTSELESGGEILTPEGRKIRWPLPYIVGRARRSNAGFIFHLKPWHLHGTRAFGTRPSPVLKQFVHALHGRGWKVIYLHRDDEVASVLSILYGLAAGKRWDNNRGVSDDFKIHIDCAEFRERLISRQALTKSMEDVVEDIDHIRVEYGRQLKDPEQHQQTADAIFDFVGLPRRAVETSFIKSHNRHQRDYIENYDEFLRCLDELKQENPL